MAQLKQSKIYNDRSFGFPIGTILMYDKTDWIDPNDPYNPNNNPTMKQWYACVAGNSGHGCPDLTDKFILGADEGYRTAYWNNSIHTFSGETTTRTGGSNSKILNIYEIPSHQHKLIHSHSNVTGNVGDQSHKHTHQKPSQTCNLDWGGSTYYSWVDFGTIWEGITSSESHWHVGASLNASYSGIGNGTENKKIYYSNGVQAHTGTPNSYNQRPQYYTVLFVRRCY